MNSDKCIIFDMDGVLIDSEPLHFDFESRLFKSLGISVPQEKHETFVGTTAKTMWTIIKKENHIPLTVPELILKSQSDFLVYLKNQKSIDLIPGIKELLDKLQDTGFKIVLASSSPHILINYILNKTGIYNYFQFKVSGDDVKNGKPDPEIFLKAADLINLKPEKCIVIEDSENGVKAAVKAEMKCIGYSNPGSGNQNLNSANLVIKSFNALTISKVISLFFI